MAPSTCLICRNPIADGARFLLVRYKRNEPYCSELCLSRSVDRRYRAHAAFRQRLLLRLGAVALVLLGAREIWHRFHRPQPQSISYDPPQIRPELPPPRSIFYGPAWPPTDEDWRFAFANTSWAYPLPGPARDVPRACDRILGGRDSAGHHPPVCHDPGHCAVDLGGELWGEHVYAAHDGIVDHIQHAPGDERGGITLRLSHLGGTVFTHYVHLAATPRGVVRGARVHAGEVIGLVGDTGNEHPGRYVHFALSVRPTSELPDLFWDPTPLMARWPLRLPPHGTVAGFVPPPSDLLPPALRRRSK